MWIFCGSQYIVDLQFQKNSMSSSRLVLETYLYYSNPFIHTTKTFPQTSGLTQADMRLCGYFVEASILLIYNFKRGRGPSPPHPIFLTWRPKIWWTSKCVKTTPTNNSEFSITFWVHSISNFCARGDGALYFFNKLLDPFPTWKLE